MKRFSNYVGIDVSKRTLDVVLFNVELKNKSPHIKVSNNSSGFLQLIKWLESNSALPNDTLFCLEYTGIYSYAITSFLNQQKLHYSLVSPLHMKRSIGLIRGKNDKVDAYQISRFCYNNRDEIVCTKSSMEEVKKVKSLISERTRIIKLRTVSKVIISEKEYYNQGQIKRAKRLLAIFQNQIKEIECEIEALIESNFEIHKNYLLMRSVTGIGLVTAAMIIAYTNNLSSISDARKFAAYSGIAPFEHTSGTSVKGKTRVSPFANKKIKGALSNGAKAAVKHDPELKIYYERKLKEGKEYGVVMNAVKFKMITRVFATVKRGTPYVKLRQAG